MKLQKWFCLPALAGQTTVCNLCYILSSMGTAYMRYTDLCVGIASIPKVKRKKSVKKNYIFSKYNNTE